ncbi:hotdog family protein [Mediterraneibacter agrestimuris]|uniref:hypothetical protein n=1 Tax=Mediterraneibacter agrestimuris TaxID=2941333 RepID=UPI00203CC359|nr:hypothetical protein [Mediterraneibacter agrestimuris]
MEKYVEVWRDLTDPRRAEFVIDLEDGLKEPEFDNVKIPEFFGPVKEKIDDYKVKRYAFELDDYLPWAMQEGGNPFGDRRIAQAALLTNDIVQLFTLAYRGSKVIGLHTEAQLWFDNPAMLDEIVELKGAYTEAYEKRGQGYVVLEAKVKGEDGRSIVRYRGVEILKTNPGKIAGRASAEITKEGKITGEIPEGAEFIDHITKQTKVGDVLTPLKKVITAEQAAVFSRVGEFVTNIHNNLEKAREGNLMIPIVQGAQFFCTFSELLTRVFGASFFTNGWVKAKFISPVKVFEPFETGGIITEIKKLEDGRRAYKLEIWIRRASDKQLAAVGWASCVC